MWPTLGVGVLSERLTGTTWRVLDAIAIGVGIRERVTLAAKWVSRTHTPLGSTAPPDFITFPAATHGLLASPLHQPLNVSLIIPYYLSKQCRKRIFWTYKETIKIIVQKCTKGIKSNKQKTLFLRRTTSKTWLFAVLFCTSFGYFSRHKNIIWTMRIYYFLLTMCWFYSAEKTLWTYTFYNDNVSSLHYGIDIHID